jgi:hypothetical protein
MKPKDTEDFAKTKHKGLPDKAKSKKKEEDVEESTTSGSVATSTATKGGGGIVGKGIYDSMNRELENMIAESMQQGSKEALAKEIYDLGMSIHQNDRMYNQDDPEGKAQLAKLKAQFAQQFPGEDAFKLGSAINDRDYQTRQQQNVAQAKQRPAGIMQKAKNALGGMYEGLNESMSVNMSDSTEGGKSLTITATDDDALKLASLLKNAGIGSQGSDMQSPGEQACDTCGMPNCGCGDVQEAVDENSPDYPTNTEQADNNFGYAGGLNKPKTDVAGDGQTTIPNTAVHTEEEDALRRMMEMAGLAEAAKPDYIDLDKDGDKEESMKDAANDKEEDSVEESIQRMREMAGIKEAKKPDFLDMDKDGDKKEPMSKAVKDKEEKKVDESIFALTNQWQAYKG